MELSIVHSTSLRPNDKALFKLIGFYFKAITTSRPDKNGGFGSPSQLRHVRSVVLVATTPINIINDAIAVAKKSVV